MTDFSKMTTAQLRDIINYKNKEIKLHDEIAAARAEYIKRLSDTYSDKGEEILSGKEMNPLPRKMPEKRVVITLSSEKEDDKASKPPQTGGAGTAENIKSTTRRIAEGIYSAGMFLICAEAFATFVLSMFVAVIAYSPVMNFYVGGAFAWLTLAVLTWYFKANGIPLGKVLLRGIIISETALGFAGGARENIILIFFMTVLFLTSEILQLQDI